MAKSKMSISSITRGITSLPWSMCVHSRDGMGKSTLANSLPGVIFLPTEPGLDRMDVQATFPLAESYADALAALDTLALEKHSYKWLALDSIDWLESLISNYICKQNNWGALTDPDFGKGYGLLHAEFSNFITKLDKLRRRKNMGIFMTCHTDVARFDDPARESYHRYKLKLRETNAAKIKEFCDIVGYLDYNVGVTEEKVGTAKVNKAKGGSRRVLRTAIHPAYDAKCRFPNIAEQIDIQQNDGFRAVLNAVNNTAKKEG